MSKAKEQMSNGCNIAGVALLGAAMFSLVTPTPITASALPIAGVAAAAVFIGTLLRFQVVFVRWEVPHISFSMKQVGMRGKRHERNQ